MNKFIKLNKQCPICNGMIYFMLDKNDNRITYCPSCNILKINDELQYDTENYELLINDLKRKV